MAGQVNVDTALMQQTAQQSNNLADNMINAAATMQRNIDYVANTWQGQAGDEFRRTMGAQSQMLTKLINRLRDISDVINRGGQGLASQDTGARSSLAGQGQNFLNTSLNA